MPPILR